MKSYLIAVGCNDYESENLSNLLGAENDAKTIHSCLVDSEYSIYNEDISSLMLSPTLSELMRAIEQTLHDNDTPDIFTFFFAGHGGVSNGTYYLFLRNSNIDRMSFSAFSLSEFFRIVSSSGVKHVNLIIDACSTGGLVNDLPSLLKPEIMGATGTFGIAILAAAASDEDALEIGNQGLFTQKLIKYINGTVRLTAETEFLDLVSVGRALSLEFIELETQQTPSSWGINLFGPSIFAKNPFFNHSAAIGSYEISYIPPASRLGRHIQVLKKEFWNILDNINDEESAQIFLNTLQDLIEDTNNIDDAITLIKGIGYRFLEQVDVKLGFKKLEIVNVLLIALHPYVGNEEVDLEVDKLIKVYAHYGIKCLNSLKELLEEDKSALVYKDGYGFDTLANYYYLPIRISKIFGMLSQLTVIEPSCLDDVKYVIGRITDTYSKHLVCMCDNQAPFLFVFFKSFIVLDQKDFVKQLLIAYLVNFIHCKGLVSDVDIPPEKAVHYLLQRYSRREIDKEYLENPGELGAVLLLLAADYEIQDQMDLLMKHLDRCNFHVFIANDIKEFSKRKIREGHNLILSAGTDFWSVDEFSSKYSMHLEEYVKDGYKQVTFNEQVCCIAGSFIRPDRLPLMF